MKCAFPLRNRRSRSKKRRSRAVSYTHLDVYKRQEVDITLVDDAAIHELNRTYRGIDRPTDVLSFALDEGEEEPEVDDDEIEHLLGLSLIHI